MIKNIITVIILIGTILWSFLALMPREQSNVIEDTYSFSVNNAYTHLNNIAKEPHYVGSTAHKEVREYIVKTLKDIGLETQIQEGYTISKWGNFSKAKNIITRIQGTDNTKALMLMSHYDSSPHSSFGASDAGSGVVTILEGIRAYLSTGKIPKNDIIILITDAEELGLNGADLFVNQHPWAEEVGLVLNFEARGSGGPSYMLIETNGGNANLIKHFAKANPKFPVTNSLAYSIYKMLPNDTDLTIFRRDGDIEGLNFAFIDDHYDYHTANDIPSRLDKKTLMQQASYLMPLLDYFSQNNLNDLKSTEDYVYFNVPLFKLISYPYSWIWFMLIIAIIVFLVLLFYGFKTRQIQIKNTLYGFLAFLGSILISSGFSFLLWQLVLIIYPHYSDMEHGFTYNGHWYIISVSLFSLAICFFIYSKCHKKNNTINLFIAPISIWLIICILIGFYLKGASFFIIPVYFALLMTFFMLKQKRPSHIILALLSVPLLCIMSPFLIMFPVGLGLQILFVSALFVALFFGLTLPVLQIFKSKKRVASFLFILAFIVLVIAHLNSGFNRENPKPNSLVYKLNSDNNSALWATYDHVLDNWTKRVLGNQPESYSKKNSNMLYSKYSSGFSFTKKAKIQPIKYPDIQIKQDTIINNLRHFVISIIPQRLVNRIDLFAHENNRFKNFFINDVETYKADDSRFAFENRYKDRLFSYYVSDNEPLNLRFSVPKEQKTTFTLYESSYDLLNHKFFNIKQRSDDMIPKPFILNDAIIITKIIVLD